MAHFWFVSAPLPGHLDWGGFLATARVLRDEGHMITWISEKQIAGAVDVPFAPVRATGWLWPPPPAPDLSQLSPAEAVMLRYRRALDTWMSEDLVADAVAALTELAQAVGMPDMIVTDPFLTAAALVAERFNVPLAVCGWPAQRDLRDDLLFPVQKTLGEESRKRLDRLCARFDLTGSNFSPGPTPAIISPHLHVCYFTREWYAADDEVLLAQNMFVGGQPALPAADPPDWLKAIPTEVPLALVTLGSVFTGDLGFFSWAANAAARADLLPVVVIGWSPITPEDKAELVRALPPSTRLLNWVDFAHVLPRTRLIIHHGGMGTTHAAAVHGVPQIVVPHAADQRSQGRRVAQAKIGLNLSAHDVRQGALVDGAQAILKDAQVQANARAFASAMAALGGPPRAAAALAALL